MWELDYKEGWAPKNWCFWAVVLEKTLESPLDCKEIQPVYPKGNQPWIFIGRTDAEAEAPILWPPDIKYWLIGKDPHVGKDWGQEEKGAIEYELTGWHHWLNGNEFEQTPGDSEGQGSLACCSPWGHKESDMTERLNNKTAVKINKLELHMLTRIYIVNVQSLEWRKGFLGLFSSIYHFIWDRTIWNQSIKKGEDGYVLWMVSETSLWMTQKRIKIKKHE